MKRHVPSLLAFVIFMSPAGNIMADPPDSTKPKPPVSRPKPQPPAAPPNSRPLPSAPKPAATQQQSVVPKGNGGYPSTQGAGLGGGNNGDNGNYQSGYSDGYHTRAPKNPTEGWQYLIGTWKVYVGKTPCYKMWLYEDGSYYKKEWDFATNHAVPDSGWSVGVWKYNGGRGRIEMWFMSDKSPEPSSAVLVIHDPTPRGGNVLQSVHVSTYFGGWFPCTPETWKRIE
jgi:hypothetical protein